jgi:uncharacterized protein YcfL
MKAVFGAGVGLALGALLLAGCLAHPSFIRVHDEELTFDDYDSTVSFDADSDEDLADAPVDVHEFDEAAATAAGAVKVIDGASWFDADDFERNDMLNEVERDEPDGTTFVICVATGEVWKIPEDKFTAVSKIIDPWEGDEYDRLDEYIGQDYAARQLTLGQYLQLTSVTEQLNFGAIRHLHDFGPIGRQEIMGVGGFQVMPRQLWLLSTPQQRSVRLDSIDAYLRHLPAFQGAGNAPNFGVTVPWGMVYAAPKAKLEYLVGAGLLKGWSEAELLSLPTTSGLTPRWPRGEKSLIIDIEPPKL